MNFSEAAKLSRISKQKLNAEIEAYAAQYRPKVMGYKIENGIRVTVLEPAHATGCGCHQWVKPKGTSGSYDV